MLHRLTSSSGARTVLATLPQQTGLSPAAAELKRLRLSREDLYLGL
jgi:hypothetical protein